MYVPACVCVLYVCIHNCREYSSSLEKQRETLMKKLTEAEMDSTAMSQQVHSLKTSLKKLKRVRALVMVVVCQKENFRVWT